MGKLLPFETRLERELRIRNEMIEAELERLDAEMDEPEQPEEPLGGDDEVI